MSSGKNFKTFKEWLASDEVLIVAEGYLMEFVRRGYVAGADFSPDIVLKNPKQVELLHEEFVHGGSDVILGYTYYANRKMMELRGLTDVVRETNIKANAIAKEVADRTGTILAGGICNTNIMTADAEAEAEIRDMYDEQVQWAIEAGVEYIVAETLNSFLEAKVAIEICKKYGLPVVVTFNLYRTDAKVVEGISVVDACKMSEDAGADVVGINCGRGPDMTLPFMRELRRKCKGPIAALPSCYRTTEKEPCWFQLTDPKTGRAMYPKDIAAMQCCPTDIEEFGKECREIGIRYVGLCCGGSGSFIRSLAESLGRRPPASRYSCKEDLTLKSIWT